MKAISLADKNKNPTKYKNMKYLGLLSGRNIEPEKQQKESIPITYSLKIPGTKNENIKNDENKKDRTNAEHPKRPSRKKEKLISEMDKNAKDYQILDEMIEKDIKFTFAKPFENGELPKVKSELESVIELDSDYEEDDNLNNNNEITEGYLYKNQGNKMKKIYFRLIHKDLYYYKSKDNKKHKGMHNLSGVYIKDEGEIKISNQTFYCFNIIFPSKERKYYVSDESEYIKWVESIRKVVNYSNLNDLYEIKGTLGKGKFGLVKKGIHNDSGREEPH